jgi:microcystin synthetase protein McyG
LTVAGVRPGDPLLLQLEGPRTVLGAFWGAILCGARPLIGAIAPAYVPGDPVFDGLRLACEKMERPRVFLRRQLAGTTAPLGAFAGDRIYFEDECAISAPQPWVVPDPNDAAFYGLSSGGGGKTKCAVLTHRGALAAQGGANRLCGHGEADTFFHGLPFDHPGALTDGHLRPLLAGSRLVYAPPEPIAANPLLWLPALDATAATHTWAPTFAYTTLLGALRALDPAPGTWDLSRLRFWLSVGEPVSPAVLTELSQRLARQGLRPEALRTAYGMTELSGGTAYPIPPPGSLPRSIAVARRCLASGPVHFDERNGVRLFLLGAPIPGARVRIRDRGRTLGPLEVGSVEVHGPHVFSGYLHDEAATAEAFTADGWFRTGDLGFTCDGELALTGREKEVLIVRGKKYRATDIEAEVERVAGVAGGCTAAVVVREGTSDRLAVFFSPAEGKATPGLASALRTALDREIGVALDRLVPVASADVPRAATGNVLKSELVRRLEAGELMPYREPKCCGGRARSQNPIENVLAGMWASLLPDGPDSLETGFFAAGGDSRLLAQLSSKIRDVFRSSLTLSELNQAATVRGMAALVEAHEPKPGLSRKIASLFLSIDGMRKAQVP